jgi:outer membrane protein OmpA-like peptidoglycan-associated protein
MENNNKFQLGLYDRSNDALIIYAGYQVNQLFIGTSYDINMSSMKSASNGKGGFEITLSYIPKARKKSKAPEPKKTQKTLAHKTPQKVEKAEKKNTATQLEQTVSIPETLQVKPVNPVFEKPVEKVKQEQAPVVVALPKEETKPVVAEEAIPVVPKAVAKVEEKKTEAPVELAKPVNDIVLKAEPNSDSKEEKIKEAPIEFSPPVKEAAKVKATEPVSKPGVKSNVVLPKSHTVYIDLTKPVVPPQPEKIKTEDTDGDGIADSEDHCPYIKGGKQTQGCPDSDNDGIQDMMDECPMEPGTAKNFGCPEIKVTVDNSALIKKFNNIEFQTGSSTIKTADLYDVIEYAIDLLYQYPNSRVILSGHTDNEGNDLFNMHLSEKRNNVVKSYMIKKGIAESRIQTVNYGETMPLDDNTSAAGRAKNRRVEVNILKK